jgi:hypothetical protein
MKLDPMQVVAVGLASGECMLALLNGEREGARRAVKYLTPHLVVKATRVIVRELLKKRGHGRPARRGARKINPRDRGCSIVVTVGAPGYKEREFIAEARRAKEPFPVKRVQVKHIGGRPGGVA